MGVIQGKPNQVFWGVPIGIIMLDTHIPFPPGDVGNATSYSYPVCFRVVEGATHSRFIKAGDRSLVDGFISAAKDLEENGVRAITGDCGFMALFQQEVASCVNVPVFLSPLLLVPMVSRMIRKDQAVGILTADSTSLTPRHLAAVGITPDMRIKIAGLERTEEFAAIYLQSQPHMDYDKVKREVLDVATEFTSSNPDLGALVLECSELPMFSADIREICNLPVFDFMAMINMVHQAVVPPRYSGHL
jgi:hypothetical protein